MKKVAISVFKAKCLAILKRVRDTNTPIVVTRFGRPIAEVIPPRPVRPVLLGTGVGTGVILGDIVGPVSDESDWEAAQDPNTAKSE